ncbi:checkpoint protein HUS1 [Tanacetum coccineum]
MSNLPPATMLPVYPPVITTTTNQPPLPPYYPSSSPSFLAPAATTMTSHYYHQTQPYSPLPTASYYHPSSSSSSSSSYPYPQPFSPLPTPSNPYPQPFSPLSTPSSSSHIHVSPPLPLPLSTTTTTTYYVAQPTIPAVEPAKKPKGDPFTKLCCHFKKKGICGYGYRCGFAHGSSELHLTKRPPNYKRSMYKNWPNVSLGFGVTLDTPTRVDGVCFGLYNGLMDRMKNIGDVPDVSISKYYDLNLQISSSLITVSAELRKSKVIGEQAQRPSSDDNLSAQTRTRSAIDRGDICNDDCAS